MNVQRLLTPKIRGAMRRYYVHRAAQGTRPWDKQGDLDFLFKALQRSKWYRSCHTCAGTFFVVWGQHKDEGVQTRHDEDNYWRGRVISRFVGGRWVEVKGGR